MSLLVLTRSPGVCLQDKEWNLQKKKIISVNSTKETPISSLILTRSPRVRLQDQKWNLQKKKEISVNLTKGNTNVTTNTY